MLTGVDKETGEKLDDVNIRYQIITFLIAGHETTSGLLSFALYFLLNNPEVLAKAYEEVDRVLGDDLSTPPTNAQVNHLRYVSQILKESLRLWPTAPAFTPAPLRANGLGGKYQIDKQRSADGSHADAAPRPQDLGRRRRGVRPGEVHPGGRTDQAAPTPTNPSARASAPASGGSSPCWRPRWCLGMILQRFELVDHTNYELKIKQTLTIKPADFRIKVRPRTTRSTPSTPPATPAVVQQEEPEAEPAVVVKGSTPLLVLFGSNLGTAEEIAHQIADDGTTHGFTTTVASLDDYTDKLPTEGGVVITTSSYNGTPPDNAAEFFDWLCNDSLGPDALEGVNYTVFGCGDRDWAATYQRVPKMIDAALEEHGARRVYQRGEGDASDDFDGQFRGWYEHLWQPIAEALGASIEEPDTVVKGAPLRGGAGLGGGRDQPAGRGVRRETDGDRGQPRAAAQGRPEPLGAFDAAHRGRDARGRDLPDGRPPRRGPPQQRRAGAARHGSLRFLR